MAKYSTKPGSYSNAQRNWLNCPVLRIPGNSGIVLARGEEILWEQATAPASPCARGRAEISAYVAADAPLASCDTSLNRWAAISSAMLKATRILIKGLAVTALLVQLHLHGVTALAP